MQIKMQAHHQGKCKLWKMLKHVNVCTVGAFKLMTFFFFSHSGAEQFTQGKHGFRPLTHSVKKERKAKRDGTPNQHVMGHILGREKGLWVLPTWGWRNLQGNLR